MFYSIEFAVMQERSKNQINLLLRHFKKQKKIYNYFSPSNKRNGMDLLGLKVQVSISLFLISTFNKDFIFCY